MVFLIEIMIEKSRLMTEGLLKVPENINTCTLLASWNFEGEREVHTLELLSRTLRVFQVQNKMLNLFSFLRKPETVIQSRLCMAHSLSQKLPNMYMYI